MKLADIFTHQMVLQRNKEIAIFGYGQGCGSIEFCGKTTTFESVHDHFCTYLPAEKEGGPYEMKITLNGEVTVLKDIMIGDVYIAAGQSNMEFTLGETVDMEWIEDTNIRIFKELHNADENLNVSYQEETWRICTRDNMSSFTAIGYDVAQLLRKNLNIPIGIISCNQGASRVDAWTAPDLVNAPDYQEMLKIKHLDYSYFRFNQDSWLYLNKLLPIVPFTVNGILWYQGESNRHPEEAVYYDKLLKIMIQNWRDLWGEKLPFYCVQLMPFAGDPDSDWYSIRKCQELVAKNVEHVYLVTLVNTGEENEIHPTKKHTVSLMLANAILHTLYGQDNIYCGPVYHEIENEEDYIRISFFHNTGLHFTNNTPEDIFLYDEHGAPHAARCSIVNDTLIIDKPKTFHPKRISMGYSNVPKHNLYNCAGFLASPFNILL